jgi:hypothetical protein
VRNPGALLYFGDGHAVQGDGELTGDALETSLDVEVTVDVIPRDGRRVSGERGRRPQRRDGAEDRQGPAARADAGEGVIHLQYRAGR